MVLQVVGLADIFIGLRVALVGIKPAVLSVYITVPVAVADTTMTPARMVATGVTVAPTAAVAVAAKGRMAERVVMAEPTVVVVAAAAAAYPREAAAAPTAATEGLAFTRTLPPQALVRLVHPHLILCLTLSLRSDCHLRDRTPLAVAPKHPARAVAAVAVADLGQKAGVLWA